MREHLRTARRGRVSSVPHCHAPRHRGKSCFRQSWLFLRGYLFSPPYPPFLHHLQQSPPTFRAQAATFLDAAGSAVFDFVCYSGPNASSTFPGTPPLRGYPELMNTIPLTTTAPGPSIEPPRPFTPFTVSKSRMVLKSQSNSPSSAERARMCPSVEVAKTTPGISVTAPGWEGLQPTGAPSGQGADVTCHSWLPSATRRAVRPPPTFGSRRTRRVSV